MNTLTTHAIELPQSAPRTARAVLHSLKSLKHGVLDVRLPDGTVMAFGELEGSAPRATLMMENWNLCSAALRSGDIGFAESYIDGDWTTTDLSQLLQLFIANRNHMESVFYGTWWGSLLYRLKHLFHRNSRAGSRKNIHAHYDLGNTFYRLWLDPTMNYSSAWFDGDYSTSLADAQQAKVRRALRECGVQPGQQLLEVGCGWGALAETATHEFGAHVTGVTLSSEQLDWAQRRLAEAGLTSDLRFQDYRDINPGPFDAIVSIEMFEAVGLEFWPSYFEMLRSRLKPGGTACIQTITIRDDLFERYARSTDFIQQYIFPGGLLPSPSEFRAAVANADLMVVNTLEFGDDYAETLRRWRHNFLSAETSIRGLGFDTRFIRIWEFYLAYCEAAFAAGNTNVTQFTLRHR